MKRMIILTPWFALWAGLVVAAENECAGFCFPATTAETGGETFEQAIPQRATVVIPGDIPVGVENLYIQLQAATDIDIGLRDQDTGKVLIGWKNNALIDSARLASKLYQGMTIEYSGYYGDGTHRGNEYVKITGLTTAPLQMELYGYQAGVAEITYSYDNPQIANSPQSGEGSFEIAVPEGGTIEIPGDIPAGVKNFSMRLDAEQDVDIQLEDPDSQTLLIAWNSEALINSSQKIRKRYNGVVIEYSGYQGAGAPCVRQGEEYVTITGVTQNRLKMKLYGYEAGNAKISYTWASVE